MKTEEIKIQINVPEGMKLVGTKIEDGVIIPQFEKINPFKKGNILVSKLGYIFMYDGRWSGNKHLCAWSAHYVLRDGFQINNRNTHYSYNSYNKPATQEQQDIFWKAAKDAGYSYTGKKGWYKEDTLSTSWEEWYKKHRSYQICKIDEYCRIKSEPIIGQSSCYANRNIIATEKRAGAFLALMQLINIRDEYRQGWDPTYKCIEKNILSQILVVISIHMVQYSIIIFCLFNQKKYEINS